MSHLPARKTISELHSNSDTTYKDQQARSCSNRSFWREELASWLWACSQPSASSCQLPPGQLQGRKPPHRSHGLAETPEPGEPVRRGAGQPRLPADGVSSTGNTHSTSLLGWTRLCRAHITLLGRRPPSTASAPSSHGRRSPINILRLPNPSQHLLLQSPIPDRGKHQAQLYFAQQMCGLCGPVVKV